MMMMSHQYLPDTYEDFDRFQFFNENELIDDSGEFEEVILEEDVELDEVRHGYIQDGPDSFGLLPNFTGAEHYRMDPPYLPDMTSGSPAPHLFFGPGADHDQILVNMGLLASTFTWIGNLECFLVDHGRFCEAYEESKQQLNNGPVPGICCFTLSSNTNLDLDVEHDDDGCLKIFIKNSYTTGLIGVIPDVFSVVLLPLVQSQLIQICGKIDALVHPDSCPPPFKLIINADLDAITNRTNLSAVDIQALKQLRRWLKRPKGVFISPELPARINSIRRTLNLPDKKNAVANPDSGRKRPAPIDAALAQTKRTEAIRPRVSSGGDAATADSAVAPLSKTSSTMELLNNRRRIRNRRELEQCKAVNVPRLINAIKHESKSWSSSERIEAIVAQFLDCRDPLSCIGRLLGATMALSVLPQMKELLSQSWSVVISGGNGGPILASPLRAALKQLLADADCPYY